jgi:hypothetical protein
MNRRFVPTVFAAPPARDFSRPLCPWREVAWYTGKGPRTEAASFVFVCTREQP